MCAGNPVLIVNGLDQARVTPDVLFTLFGVFGDVIRVKILFNKRDTALIQFVDSSQAEVVSLYPHRCNTHEPVVTIRLMAL